MNADAWHGWRWDGERWLLLSTGRTIAEAHRRLNRLLPRRTPSPHAALTAGAAPTWRPAKEVSTP